MRTLLSVDVWEPGADYPEAEPLVVESDASAGGLVALILDDGTRVVVDRAELIRAVVAGRGEVAA